jgi:uncharacterized protein (DUF2062 family)
VHNVLGLDDTPHRIALGVALGWVVAWTPTIGLQIVIYFALAALLRANKIAGLPPLFVTNPVTAVPIYYAAWRLGAWVMGDLDEVAGAALAARIRDLARLSEEPFSTALWGDLARTILDLGVNLWVGCALVGFVAGVPSYFATKAAVRGFRMARARRRRQRLAAARTSSPTSVERPVATRATNESLDSIKPPRFEGPDAVP